MKNTYTRADTDRQKGIMTRKLNNDNGLQD